MNAENRVSPIVFYGINILVPLLIGLLLYLLFRRDAVIVEYLGKKLSLPNIEFNLPQWIERIARNYATDFLWAYSLVYAVSAVYKYTRANAIGIGLICMAFIILIEALQNTAFFLGTFDIVDILVEFVSSGLALLIIDHYHKEGHNEKDRKSH